MPEGPEIRRIADRLHRLLAGRRLRAVRCLPPLPDWSPRLAGRRVIAATARGKTVLIEFEDGRWLLAHSQLYGRWELLAPGETPRLRRSLRLELEVAEGRARLYSATEVALLDADALARHPRLSRLGPDVLDPDTDAETVMRALERGGRRALFGLLQDQRVLAGIGNYLACEILHAAGVHPRTRPVELSADALAVLAECCLRLPRRAYRTGGVTNDPRRAERMAAAGMDFEARRFLVYRRAGAPCHHCGAPVHKSRIGGRPVYHCPRCQPRVAR